MIWNYSIVLRNFFIAKKFSEDIEEKQGKQIMIKVLSQKEKQSTGSHNNEDRKSGHKIFWETMVDRWKNEIGKNGEAGEKEKRD